MVEKYLDPGIKDRWQARGRQSAHSSQSSVPKRRGAHIGWTDDSRGGGLRIDNEADGGVKGRVRGMRKPGGGGGDTIARMDS